MDTSAITKAILTGKSKKLTGYNSLIQIFLYATGLP